MLFLYKHSRLRILNFIVSLMANMMKLWIIANHQRKDFSALKNHNICPKKKLHPHIRYIKKLHFSLNIFIILINSIFDVPLYIKKSITLTIQISFFILM